MDAGKRQHFTTNIFFTIGGGVLFCKILLKEFLSKLVEIINRLEASHVTNYCLDQILRGWLKKKNNNIRFNH